MDKGTLWWQNCDSESFWINQVVVCQTLNPTSSSWSCIFKLCWPTGTIKSTLWVFILTLGRFFLWQESLIRCVTARTDWLTNSPGSLVLFIDSIVLRSLSIQYVIQLKLLCPPPKGDVDMTCSVQDTQPSPRCGLSCNVSVWPNKWPTTTNTMMQLP